MSRIASYNGYEILLYPLDNVGITADPYASNHTVTGVGNTGIWDNGWHYNIHDPLYAPCTMRLVANPHDAANTQMYVSQDPVWIPGQSSPTYVTMSFSHSNTLYYNTIGDVVPQGTHFYDTGDAGLGSGPHVHMILGIGARTSIWPVGYNSLYGNIYYSPNPPGNIADFFYLLDTDTISNDWGLTWSRWSGGSPVTNARLVAAMIIKRKKKGGVVLWT